MIGGAGAPFANWRPEAEIYNPGTDHWTPIRYEVPEYRHTSVLLEDGRVLVVGGWNNRTAGTALPAEIYDPDAGALLPAGGPDFNDRVVVAKLWDGRVLAVGGLREDGAHSDAVYLFDPLDDGWHALTPLSVKRSRHRVVALSGGLALIAGGQDDGFRALSSVEIYDPDGGGASAVLAEGLSHGRLGFTSTVLDDGEVIFVAGAEMDGGSFSGVHVVDRLRVGW